MAVVRRVVLGSLIALLVAAGMPGSATPAAAADPPETVTVAAAADSSVLARSASSNLGSAALLTVDGSPVETSYLKFDLSALAGRTVTKAVLQVRSAGSASVGVQNVTLVTDDSWTERGITYSNRPALGQAVGSLSAARRNTAHAIPLPRHLCSRSWGRCCRWGWTRAAGTVWTCTPARRPLRRGWC